MDLKKFYTKLGQLSAAGVFCATVGAAVMSAHGHDFSKSFQQNIGIGDASAQVSQSGKAPEGMKDFRVSSLGSQAKTMDTMSAQELLTKMKSQANALQRGGFVSMGTTENDLRSVAKMYAKISEKAQGNDTAAKALLKESTSVTSLAIESAVVNGKLPQDKAVSVVKTELKKTQLPMSVQTSFGM